MSLAIVKTSINHLKPYANNARTHSQRQIEDIARSIKNFGFNNPILIDGAGIVIAGHGRLEAAKVLGLAEVPTISLDHLNEVQRKAYILADNKLAEKAGWDTQLLKIEFQTILELDPDCDLTSTGFDTPQIDIIINDASSNERMDPVDELTSASAIPHQVASGELWQLGRHFLYCGDSLKEESFNILLGDKRADLIFTDPPYNVPINGHVCGNGVTKHTNFVHASGEMSSPQFVEFLKTAFSHLVTYSALGSIHYVCMDWRHVPEITAAGNGTYSELKNICVWNKQLGGMGSLYRSQHEFIFVFKNGNAPHINNIELGKHGRYRTNVWDYPGVHASNSHRSELKLHPTVKPVQMIADAIVDCSKQGAIILDCFAGSGSTLLAAERVKRTAYLIEYEPKYCDVILYRFEKMTGIKPLLVQGAIHGA